MPLCSHIGSYKGLKTYISNLFSLTERNPKTPAVSPSPAPPISTPTDMLMFCPSLSIACFGMLSSFSF